jgi:stage II sporulation protein D
MRRLFVPAAVAAVLAVTATIACAAPAPEVTVPDQATLTISGHGWGHGHGMSQYGAQGAARAGRSAADIVGFYYPGTTPAQVTGAVKVLLTADSDNDTIVLPRTNLILRDLKTKERWTLPANGATRWRLSSSSTGVSVVTYKTDRWHRFRTLAGDGEFYAWGQPITLVTPSGTTAYRGALRSLRSAVGSTDRDTVNVLLLDNYLKGVVPREMPAFWSPAAVQAQAIAARTYAAYERAHPLSTNYQICDTTSCQVYGGYSSEDSRANEAIKATAGQILTYDGAPAFTQFSSSNGGWSAAGSAPYLTAEQDPYDSADGTNPNHDWTLTLDAAQVERRFPRIGNLTGITMTRSTPYDQGGRVSSITLYGSTMTKTVSGDDFRSVFGLKSTWFTLAATAKS